MIISPGISNYIQREIIASGGYGYVYRCKDAQTNELVALKQVPIDMDVEGFPSSLIREISLLKEVPHPNIVTLKQVLYEQKNAYLVFEYLKENLKEYIQNKAILRKEIDPKTIKLYLYSILDGVALCHRRNFFHRDLKTQNILIDDQGKLKIADFGLARTYFIPDGNYTEEVVTLWYRAPEIILRQRYSTPVDIWSIGCIFAEMLAKRILFRGNSEVEQLNLYFKAFGTPAEKIWPNINWGKFEKYQRKTIQEIVDNQHIDEQAVNLLERMFELNPKKRITAAQALKHPYFEGIHQ